MQICSQCSLNRNHRQFCVLKDAYKKRFHSMQPTAVRSEHLISFETMILSLTRQSITTITTSIQIINKSSSPLNEDELEKVVLACSVRCPRKVTLQTQIWIHLKHIVHHKTSISISIRNERSGQNSYLNSLLVPSRRRVSVKGENPHDMTTTTQTLNFGVLIVWSMKQVDRSTMRWTSSPSCQW